MIRFFFLFLLSLALLSGAQAATVGCYGEDINYCKRVCLGSEIRKLDDGEYAGLYISSLKDGWTGNWVNFKGGIGGRKIWGFAALKTKVGYSSSARFEDGEIKIIKTPESMTCSIDVYSVEYGGRDTDKGSIEPYDTMGKDSTLPQANMALALFEENANKPFAYLRGRNHAPPGCFVAGTRIDTPQGSRAIETLKIGESVWAQDASGQLVEATIEKAMTHEDVPILEVVVEKEGKVFSLFTTDEHPFFVAGGKDLSHTIAAKDLRPGDLLSYLNGDSISRDGKVIEVLPTSRVEKVYNITVKDHHNYFSEGILVHNKI